MERRDLIGRIIDNTHQALRYLPYLLIAASVFVLGILIFIIRRVDFFGFAAIILGSVTIASIFVIYTRRTQSDTYLQKQYLYPFNQKRLTKLFFIVSALLIIANILSEGKPVFLLFLLGLLYIIIILQIFSKSSNTTIILLEMIIATAFLIVPQIFSPAFYYADGDVLPHTQWTHLIAETGYVSDLFGDYKAYCTYHVISSMMSQAGLLPDNIAIYSVSVTAFLISVVFVYYTFKWLTDSKFTPLFGTFFYITSSIMLTNFLKLAPRIMATVGFFIILYLIFRKWNTTIIPAILGSLVSIYVMLTHHAQTPVFLFVIGLLCFGALIYHKKLFVGNVIVYVVYLASVVVYFLYTYFDNIVFIIKRHVLPAMNSEDIIASVFLENEYYISLTSLLQYSISIPIIILGIFGVYLLITKVSRTSRLIILLPFALLAFIFIPGGVVEVIPGVEGLSVYRWRMVLNMLFSLVMALGIIYFITVMAKRHPQHPRIGTAIMMWLCICTAITSPILLNSWDNDLQYADEFIPKEYFFVDSDIALFNYMSSNIANGSTVFSDREHVAYAYHESSSSIYYPYYVRSYDMMPLFTDDDASINTQYIIFPKEKYYRAGIWIKTRPEGRKLVEASDETNSIFSKNTYAYSTIYHNGDSMNFLST